MNVAASDSHEWIEHEGTDAEGNIWHALPVAVELAESSKNAQTVAGGAPFALSQTFLLHSNPTASHRIYLDFDGHVTTGTSWNSKNKPNIVTPEFDIDGVKGFSNTELERIQSIWQRVAEDFIPFDIDVTTEAPADSGDLIKSGSEDSRWGVRICIGGSSSDWFGSSAGGVAYVGSFNWNTDTPAFVFSKGLGNGNEKYIAEAVSHEAGHTLGLSHDGRSSPKEGYYSGHGDGETGWAPIMGVSYYKSLTQWSKGEYAKANQKQDDLSIITSKNGFGFRADDYGNTNATAALVHFVTATSFEGTGIIENWSDIDVFSFQTGSGIITVNVRSFERGANLDILAELYDSAGVLVVSANPTDLLDASLNATVIAGEYFLHISGIGKADPLTTGYTAYGSLGQYSLTGSIVDLSGLPTVSVSNASANEDGTLTFTVTLSAEQSDPVSVNYSTKNGSATASSDYEPVSGTLTFLPGEVSRIVKVNLLDDSDNEGTETMSLILSDAIGSFILVGQGTGTIIDNDSPPLPKLSISDVQVIEGGVTNKRTNAPKVTIMTFTVTLSEKSSQTVKANYVTADDTATVADRDYRSKSGSLTFSPGVTSRKVTVAILGDTIAESNETFTVNLSGATNATIGSGTAFGTILDDDGAANVNLRSSKRTSKTASSSDLTHRSPLFSSFVANQTTTREAAQLRLSATATFEPSGNNLASKNKMNSNAPDGISSTDQTLDTLSDAALTAVDELFGLISQRNAPLAVLAVALPA